MSMCPYKPFAVFSATGTQTSCRIVLFCCSHFVVLFAVFPYHQRSLTGSWMNMPWETSFHVNTSEFKMFHSSWQSLRMISLMPQLSVTDNSIKFVCTDYHSQYHSCVQNLPWLWWLSWLTGPWPAWRNNIAVLHWMRVIDRFMLCHCHAAHWSLSCGSLVIVMRCCTWHSHLSLKDLCPVAVCQEIQVVTDLHQQVFGTSQDRAIYSESLRAVWRELHSMLVEWVPARVILILSVLACGRSMGVAAASNLATKCHDSFCHRLYNHKCIGIELCLSYDDDWLLILLK